MAETNNIGDPSSTFDEVGLDDFQHPQATMDAVAATCQSTEETTQGEHDQLPNVDEYKASQGITNTESLSHRRKVVLIVAFLISVSTVMLFIGLVIKAGNEPKFIPDSPEPAPVKHTLRAKTVATFLGEMGWTDRLAVRTPGSPQYKAAYWLAELDPLQMEAAIDQEYMQRFVLATFYYALDGPHWSHEVNWMSKVPSCKWNTFYRTHSKIPVDVGASCYGGESLRQIYLPGLSLRGELPSELGLLLDLSDFDLHNNMIGGVLPEELKNLHELKNLRLNQNRLIGNLPMWIADLTNLKSLQLADNSLQGELPDNLPKLKKLTNLVLERNDLSGGFEKVHGLHGLKSLYLGGNGLTGQIKDQTLISMQRLEVLDVSNNKITGPLPQDLFSMSKLIVADLHGNSLSGHLPPFAEYKNKLQFLALQDNSIGGTLGHRLDALKHLEHLDLSRNFFTGTMPENLGKLKSLKYLFLAFNTLLAPGPIPLSYATLPKLVDISLQKTNRNGTIPYEFNIESDELVLLDLNSNHLTGTIPTELGRMKKLKFLLLKDNKLIGSIPSEFSKLESLHTLLVEDNDLTGSFDKCPPSFSPSGLISADCDELSSCKCCTKCCAGTCTEIEYFSGLDPVASGNYARDSYNLLDEDPEYTVPVESKPAKKPGFYENYTGYDFDPLEPLMPP